jgi:hypothetical protein
VNIRVRPVMQPSLTLLYTSIVRIWIREDVVVCLNKDGDTLMFERETVIDIEVDNDGAVT